MRAGKGAMDNLNRFESDSDAGAMWSILGSPEAVP